MGYLEVINPSLNVFDLLENVNRRYKDGIPFLELISVCENTLGYFPFKAVDEMNGSFFNDAEVVYYPIIDGKVILDE